MRATLAALVVACLVVPALGQQAAPTNETPTEFYLRYHATVPVATTLQQIVSFWSVGDRQEFEAAPASDRPGLENRLRAGTLAVGVHQPIQR